MVGTSKSRLLAAAIIAALGLAGLPARAHPPAQTPPGSAGTFRSPKRTGCNEMGPLTAWTKRCCKAWSTCCGPAMA